MIVKRYRCLNCGNRFEMKVFTDDELREAKRRNQPVYPIHCPEFGRNAIQEGWD